MPFWIKIKSRRERIFIFLSKRFHFRQNIRSSIDNLVMIIPFRMVVWAPYVFVWAVPHAASHFYLWRAWRAPCRLQDHFASEVGAWCCELRGGSMRASTPIRQRAACRVLRVDSDSNSLERQGSSAWWRSGGCWHDWREVLRLTTVCCDRRRANPEPEPSQQYSTTCPQHKSTTMQRCNDPTPIQHKSNTNSTQAPTPIQHKSNTNSTQVQHQFNNNKPTAGQRVARDAAVQHTWLHIRPHDAFGIAMGHPYPSCRLGQWGGSPAWLGQAAHRGIVPKACFAFLGMFHKWCACLLCRVVCSFRCPFGRRKH